MLESTRWNSYATPSASLPSAALRPCIAHELGTPLNVVAGRAKLIASGELARNEEGAKRPRRGNRPCDGTPDLLRAVV